MQRKAGLRAALSGLKGHLTFWEIIIQLFSKHHSSLSAGSSLDEQGRILR